MQGYRSWQEYKETVDFAMTLHHRLILYDYDGTLAYDGPLPNEAVSAVKFLIRLNEEIRA